MHFYYIYYKEANIISYHPPKHGAHDTNEEAKEGFKIAETCVGVEVVDVEVEVDVGCVCVWGWGGCGGCGCRMCVCVCVVGGVIVGLKNHAAIINIII